MFYPCPPRFETENSSGYFIGRTIGDSKYSKGCHIFLAPKGKERLPGRMAFQLRITDNFKLVWEQEPKEEAPSYKRPFTKEEFKIAKELAENLKSVNEHCYMVQVIDCLEMEMDDYNLMLESPDKEQALKRIRKEINDWWCIKYKDRKESIVDVIDRALAKEQQWV